MSRPLPRLVLALFVALAPLGPLACNKGGLVRIDPPKGGVRLAYDLAPGATYEGHVRVGATLNQDGENLNQAIECDVRMVVLGEDGERPGTLVQATFNKVDVDAQLPRAYPISVEEFTRGTVAALQGMSVRFTVDETGKIVYMPPPPEGSDQLLGVMIGRVLDALESAFLVVPKRSVEAGESWSDEEKRGRKGKLGRYREGTVQTKVEGLFRDEKRKEDVVKLEIKQKRTDVVTTKDGRRETQSEGTTFALFSTRGYLAEIKGETRDYDPVQGMSFKKVLVEWRKVQDGSATKAAPAPAGEDAATEEQAITDPCDPDYVGGEECKEATPTEAAPAEGDAPPSATPGG
jgi:hypothetical protein